MINYSQLKQSLDDTRLAPWYGYFVEAVEQRFKQYTHGELEIWHSLIEVLPPIDVRSYSLADCVTLEAVKTLDEPSRQKLVEQLMLLHPWRKGPFNLFGVEIDSEWRSDWKWQRIQPHIADLKGRLVLDVGCGNGYHLWRMVQQQAQLVLGIDPSQKFLAQFNCLQKYLQIPSCHLLPIGIEDMPLDMERHGFDSVFCMGVLYHQKSPVELLNRLKGLLNKGGQLILETLVIDGDENQVLVPEGRYAQMRNVWFIPSARALEKWLKKIGFNQVETIDISVTSLKEQRATEWMTFHSLKDFLDPADKSKTIEGLPAPKRATLIASK
ncbi:MAG: tRNA 5-methoxyuridine(34)/uridine 5-oxyacetic acid(34) synthase CmoB [Enterobacterales bacterium]|nr:tRNA 5-methoxyuridine(34)/uridine 5-oxyacetic acid(34) synthase CmoB [Enterobacterales bacterium]